MRWKVMSWSLFPVHVIVLLSCYNLESPGVFGLSAFVGGGGGGNATDHQALLEFKAKINGDKLGVMQLWNNSIHFCRWYGVSCGRRHQRVTMLVLKSQHLTGSISPYVGNLSFLRLLDLRNNSFFHEIPQEIGRLHRLRTLILYNNSIGGEIPSNISGCSKLTTLLLSNNQLVGKIPDEFHRMPNLTALILEGNNLTGSISPFLGNISSLEALSFLDNRLDGFIPETLGQLTKLTFLSLGLNNLSGTASSSIFSLSNIRTFDIADNYLEGVLPWDLGITMPYVEVFLVGNNRFIGQFPISISNASNLRELQVTKNLLTGSLPSFEKLANLRWFFLDANFLGSRGENDLDFICSLTNATNLQKLSIIANNFGGSIPQCIRNLSTDLTHLNLALNEISGTIPAGIGNLSGLESLILSDNQLSGAIPSDIGRLQNLKEFKAQNNSLSKAIPSSLGNLTSLITLYLNLNNLLGRIPSSLGECKNLLELDLSYNSLTGSIPPQVVALSSLSIALDLSSNHLNGVLPLEVGNFKNLGVLLISNNMLSGKLPETLGSCLLLERLFIDGNYFQGSFSSSLISLRALIQLDISSNNFSGEIPKFLSSFKSLQYLNLSHNDFEGMVPTEGVFKNTSATFIEGNSMLCGGTPDFHLPKCNSKSSRKRMINSRKLILSIAFGVLGVALASLFLCWFRKARKQPKSTSTESFPLNLTYQSILKATDGFSSANLVGGGSFGSVYKGTLENHNGIDVAIKVFNLARTGASKSFIAECKALRNVRHRNLVKLRGLVASISVHPRDPNSRKKLTLYQRLSVALDVSFALEYLHSHCGTSIVHCDLKPSNVLLDDEMVGHVGDFGLSKFRSDVQSYSKGQSSSLGFRGTIGYAPPEYGLGSEVSTKGDVYSYGILLLEMFTLKRPTDEMFKEGLNLHNFVKEALPGRVAEITDPILLEEAIRKGRSIDKNGQESSSSSSRNSIRDNDAVIRCLNSIFGIGVACSTELPSKRMNMNDVAAQLVSIRNMLSSSTSRAS